MYAIRSYYESIDWDFVKKNMIFAAGPVNIGYGLRRDGEKSLKSGKYTDKEMEIISKEMTTIVSESYNFV